MIELQKTGIMPTEYNALEDCVRVASFTRSRFRSRAVMQFNGQTFTMKKGGIFQTSYSLYQEETLVLKLEQPSWTESVFVFEFDEIKYRFGHKLSCDAELFLVSGGLIIGRVDPTGFFNDEAVADLPTNLPLEIRIFITWVALNRWKYRTGTDG